MRIVYPPDPAPASADARDDESVVLVVVVLSSSLLLLVAMATTGSAGTVRGRVTDAKSASHGFNDDDDEGR